MSEVTTRVLGIDTSLRCTGYGVVESTGGRMRAVTYGCLRTKPAWLHTACLRCIRDGLSEVIETTQPTAASIEGAFFARNIRTAMTLGEARGVAIVTCAAHDIPVYEFAPRRVKLALTGRGGAEKEQVMSMVMRLLGLQEKLQPDAADALALAICRLQCARGLAALEDQPI